MQNLSKKNSLLILIVFLIVTLTLNSSYAQGVATPFYNVNGTFKHTQSDIQVSIKNHTMENENMDLKQGILFKTSHTEDEIFFIRSVGTDYGNSSNKYVLESNKSNYVLFTSDDEESLELSGEGKNAAPLPRGGGGPPKRVLGERSLSQQR